MRLLHVYAQASLSWDWLQQSPPLSKLLKCFDVKREGPDPPPISSYQVESDLDEVKIAAALFIKTPQTPDKRFGVIVNDTECDAAGIVLDFEEEGTTGLPAIDQKHVNLKGTVAQFSDLVSYVVKGMWQGDQRLRLYPAQQIVGEIAVFSKLPEVEILPDARAECLAVLAKKDWHVFQENSRQVVIHGHLSDRVEYPVIARKDY